MGYNLDRLAADPAYAPGIVQAKDLLYWRCSRSYIKQGYTSATIKLPGRAGDGRDLERAAKCRDYAREVIQWAADLEKPKVEPGTWRWLIQRYRHEETSDYHGVKENTRQSYDFDLERWLDNPAADVKILDTDYVMLSRWRKVMAAGGRSDHYIRKMFGTLRRVTGYGRRMKVPGARDVEDIFSTMRNRTPTPRDVAPTRAQVETIIAQCDAAGHHGMALCLQLQWWLSTRCVDIKGHYLGKRWADGLTWDMVDLASGTIRKTPSKTQKSDGRVMEWDISLVPDIMARLEAIPKEQRVGPVIRQKTGGPYKKRHWTDLFREMARAAGVPDEVRSMDLRAGALTEAKNMGATLIDLQHAATHASPATTNRYIRDREAAASKVISLRRTGAQPG